MSVLGTDAAGTICAIQQLSKQLDSFKTRHLFLGQFEMLGRGGHRRGGAHPQGPLLYKHVQVPLLKGFVRAGQAVVQFARRLNDGREYAVKFFLDRGAFYAEAALYAAYFPALRKLLTSDAGRASIHMHACDAPSIAGGIAGGRFLPHVEAVCDSAEAGLVDPRGRSLPPCTVMEMGESLQELCDRAEPDCFTTFAVRTTPCSMHVQSMYKARVAVTIAMYAGDSQPCSTHEGYA